MRSLVLQLGHLRSTLSGYVVESLSVSPFPVTHQLLATWSQSIPCSGLGGSASPRTRIE